MLQEADNSLRLAQKVDDQVDEVASQNVLNAALESRQPLLIVHRVEGAHLRVD